MNKISVFFNYILSSVCFAAVLLGLVYSITRSLLASALIAAMFFAMFSVLFFYINNKRELKFNVGKKLKEKNERVRQKLLLSSDNENALFFCRLFSLPENLVSGEFIDNGTVCYAAAFYSNELDERDFYRILRNAKTTDIEILCLNASKTLKAAATTFVNHNIVFRETEYLFNLMREKNVYPEIAEITSPEKQKFKTLLKEAVSRQKAWGYAALGALVCVMSFISPFKLYYQIFAGILIVIAVTVFFVKTDNG